jgi:hydrogenase small subunit
MPFMDEPPGAKVSSTMSGVYGGMVRKLRRITQDTLDKEPRWRHPGKPLNTGYKPRAY